MRKYGLYQICNPMRVWAKKDRTKDRLSNVVANHTGKGNKAIARITAEEMWIIPDLQIP